MKRGTATIFSEAKPKKKTVGRSQKHPWDEMETLYIKGEDVEKPGKAGRRTKVHEWPTQSDLSTRYELRLDQVSRRFCAMDRDRKTVNDRQFAFKTDYVRRVSAELMKVLVEREIRFRLASLALAELALSQITHQLSRPQTTDNLVKLMTAAKRAQEVGMVALDRPSNGSEGGACLGAEDWSLMREIHRGARSIPGPCPGSPGLDR